VGIESPEIVEIEFTPPSTYTITDPENPEVEITVPRTYLPPVTARQVRLALLGMGITMEQVTGALSSLEEPARSYALVEWEYATRFQRDNAFISNVAQILGWGDSELDALWIAAKAL
jgi:hypothetical protein